MTNKVDDKIKAAVFDRLIKHLQDNTDVQNIDLMITGQFCRNCFYKWTKEAADAEGVALSVEEAQAYVYGMPYGEWKEKYQKPATDEQMEAFNRIHKPS